MFANAMAIIGTPHSDKNVKVKFWAAFSLVFRVKKWRAFPLVLWRKPGLKQQR